MSFLLLSPIYNLSVAITTNPLFALPQHKNNLPYSFHIKQILEAYKSLFIKETHRLHLPISIETIVNLLLDSIGLGMEGDEAFSKQMFSRMMNILVEHYSLIENDKNSNVINLALNPFQISSNYQIVKKSQFQYINCSIPEWRVLLNYWFWYPILLATCHVPDQLNQIKCATLLNNWIASENQQTGINISLIIPTFSSDFHNNDSFLTKYFKLENSSLT